MIGFGRRQAAGAAHVRRRSLRLNLAPLPTVPLPGVVGPGAAAEQHGPAAGFVVDHDRLISIARRRNGQADFRAGSKKSMTIGPGRGRTARAFRLE